MLDTALVIELGREALWVAVLIAGPLLGIALIVGLIIGIIQAATSINEMTFLLSQNCGVGRGISSSWILAGFSDRRFHS